jgi:hypothetical protein
VGSSSRLDADIAGDGGGLIQTCEGSGATSWMKFCLSPQGEAGAFIAF